MSVTAVVAKRVESPTVGVDAKAIVSALVSKEIVIAVVGHTGSGTSEIAEAIQGALERDGQFGGAFSVYILKASEIIRSASVTQEARTRGSIADAIKLQDDGDQIRLAAADNSKIAKEFVSRIRAARASAKGELVVNSEPVHPDGTKRAYILDSLRHPDEVLLLRAVYQEAFILVGVVCDPDVRKSRLSRKFPDAGANDIDLFMERDADGQKSNGQKVAETFFMSDFFIDNTETRYLETGGVNKANSKWRIADELTRLSELVTHERIVRPTTSETAMYHAHGSRMRSACLSRQVGAALVDSSGEIIATGCNEAPAAGGGVYTGEGDDFRCAMHHGYCSSVREQNRIIDEIIDMFPELSNLDGGNIRLRFRRSPISGLLEFSRAVHAEMDALLAAARKGISTVGTKLFVTTYPCHYCARHIIAAGVDEVQYIEPYPKSLTFKLHDDAVTRDPSKSYPSVLKQQRRTGGLSGDMRVIFKPFTGVAPRLYRRVFLKEQSLKDKHTGVMKISPPDWGGSLAIKSVSYVELEAKLANE